MLRYRLESATGEPEVAESFDLVSAGVMHGLQFDVLARAKISAAYFC